LCGVLKQRGDGGTWHDVHVELRESGVACFSVADRAQLLDALSIDAETQCHAVRKGPLATVTICSRSRAPVDGEAAARELVLAAEPPAKLARWTETLEACCLKAQLKASRAAAQRLATPTAPGGARHGDGSHAPSPFGTPLPARARAAFARRLFRLIAPARPRRRCGRLVGVARDCDCQVDARRLAAPARRAPARAQRAGNAGDACACPIAACACARCAADTATCGFSLGGRPRAWRQGRGVEAGGATARDSAGAPCARRCWAWGKWLSDRGGGAGLWRWRWRGWVGAGVGRARAREFVRRRVITRYSAWPFDLYPGSGYAIRYQARGKGGGGRGGGRGGGERKRD
jgi:hypothetical protein